MIGYITLGTNNLEAGAAFYDALLAGIGGKRIMETEKGVMWSQGENSPVLTLTGPHNGEPASVGNGTMVGLKAESREQVDSVYATAIELGASNEGAAGPRGDSGFYAGYFRDPDGNKLCIYHY